MPQSTGPVPSETQAAPAANELRNSSEQYLKPCRPQENCRVQED